jgi:rhamnogalacturonan endolyase
LNLWKFHPVAMARLAIALAAGWLPAGGALADRQMENLGRGVVAIRPADGDVFVQWRLLASDAPDVAFNVYRATAGGEPVKINPEPLRGATHLVDPEAAPLHEHAWFVRPVVGGSELAASARFVLPAGDAAKPYLSIPIAPPDDYHANDASVGDLDGDGEYEIVVHLVGRGRDNSQNGRTTEPIFDAYRLDGTRLWRINLGRNIREGAHYTPFIVYDLDGDGRAEFACRTADGTQDGQGTFIGDRDADHRNEQGRILSGPEFLTIFDGRTGAALATADYIPPRGEVSDWGDDRANRSDRFLACVAYLDGQRPSLVMCRGYYTRCVLAAWNWRDGKLANVWTFDSDDGTPGNEAYRGQGNHSLAVGDVDADGRDEIVYGSCVIDDNGAGLYSTGLGHGDAMHFGDIDPARSGLEVFKANGDGPNPAGIQLRDAATGEQIFGVASKLGGGIGRAVALDVDPRHVGLEMWGYDTPGRSRRGGWWMRRRRPDGERSSEPRDRDRRDDDERRNNDARPDGDRRRADEAERAENPPLPLGDGRGEGVSDRSRRPGDSAENPPLPLGDGRGEGSRSNRRSTDDQPESRPDPQRSDRTARNRDFPRDGDATPGDRPRSGATGLYNARGEQITKAMPRPCNMGVWWDGDLLRELLDGVRVTKWDYQSERESELLDGRDYECASNNGSKSNPCLCADILGDWREEIIARTRDSRELRIFVTTIPTERRLTTLMHDPVYRLAIAWQNVAYNQPAHPGFYLGHDMPDPPRPSITTAARD